VVVGLLRRATLDPYRRRWGSIACCRFCRASSGIAYSFARQNYAWLKSIFAVFTTWNSAAISHKTYTKSRIIQRTNRTFTFHTDVSDANEVYVLKMTHLVKQVSSDAAISTSVTPHDLLLISPTIIYRPADIALRITFIPCYGFTVPDYNWCNVDDTIS